MVRAAVAVIALLVLCGAMVGAPQARAAIPAAAEPQWASPAEMERLLEQEFLDRHLPGLAATILLHGEVYLEANFGEATVGGPAVTQDTPFVLGSTSKQFTGLLVQQLIGDGRLTLDTPVPSILPELGAGDERWSRVTIGHLLSHRSGLTEADGMKRWHLGAEPVSIQADLRRVAAIRLASGPGEHYEYSNANYDLLGAVVERVTGDSFESALRGRIVEPLGLTSTTSNLDAARADGLATGYYTWFRRWNTAVPSPYPASAAPSSFTTSSARDLSRVVQAHLGTTRGVDAGALAGSREPVGAVAHRVDYASGWFVRPMWELADRNEGWHDLDLPVLVEHSGDTSRSQSRLVIVPEYGLGIVLLSNAGPGTDPTQQQRTLDAVLHEMLGTVPQEAPTHLLVDSAPALMVAVPLLQLLSLGWLVLGRPSGGSRLRSSAPLVVAGMLGVVAVVLSLWVVPGQTEVRLIDTAWWVAAPDLAIAVGVMLLLALVLMVVLLSMGLRHRAGRSRGRQQARAVTTPPGAGS